MRRKCVENTKSDNRKLIVTENNFINGYVRCSIIMIKVSIIVPIYNAEKYLYQCLESIRKQTLKDIEIICVNDGSTDKSGEIIDKFCHMDKRFSAVHKDNRGNGHSMNVGIERSCGEYIGCVEADDYIDEKMFEKLYMLSNDGKVDIVKGNFWNCYEDDDKGVRNVVNSERKHISDSIRPFTIHECPQILWGHPSIWSAIYRRTLIEDNRIVFKEEKGGGWVDNPFFFEVMCCAQSIMWTQRPFYYYRTDLIGSSSNGYDFNIPFDRMMDNLSVLRKCNTEEEEVLKNAYARALMYLDGAVKESNIDGHEWDFNHKAREMLARVDSSVIRDDFNERDNFLFWRYASPLRTLFPATNKVLIYNWVPFDNPNGVGGGVTVYCKNLIRSIIDYRPDVEVFFISSGWAYDISRSDCYIRRIDNIYGDRCKTFEVVNSPVPAPQDMLFNNPEVAFNNSTLKNTFKDFIEKYGKFDVIHFNNMEGLSLDVLSLKEDFQDTRFIFSLHNYVPFCMTGFYYRRDKHMICKPNCKAQDCESCIDRSNPRNYQEEMVARGMVNCQNSSAFDKYEWIDSFEFDRLNLIKGAEKFIEFKKRATESLNRYIDSILAVSKRVYDIAVENEIREELLQVNYIGTRVAQFQIGRSAYKIGEYFRIVFLGSSLEYEEKGYPFLLDALSKMDIELASHIDLVLTTTTINRDEHIQEKLKYFHDIKIVHGYNHSELHKILQGANLGIVPVLWEDNLPQIAIEMVSYGIPILCSTAGGASELSCSPHFKYEAGNVSEFISKIEDIINNPKLLDEFWESSCKLTTNKQHFNEISKIYMLRPPCQVNVAIDEYSQMLEENDFLYRCLKSNSFIEQDSRFEAMKNQMLQAMRERDEYAWRLDETRKSKTYKIALWLSSRVQKNNNK